MLGAVRGVLLWKKSIAVAAAGVMSVVAPGGKCDAVHGDARYVFVPEDIAQMYAEKNGADVTEIPSDSSCDGRMKVNGDEKSTDSDSVVSMLECDMALDWPNESFFGLEDIARQGPTLDEVECAVDVVKSFPGISSALSQLDESQVANLLNQSIAHAMNADFRYDMVVKMEQKRKEKNAKIAFQDSTRENIDDNTLQKWDDLVNNYRCLICQDILSAPVLTPCCHSFCFHCITEKANSCIVVDDTMNNTVTAEVLQECPTCRHEFITKDARFERHLHTRIMEEVVSFPESLRSDWEMRRQTYLNYEKKTKEDKARQEEELALQQEESIESLRHLQSWRSICNKFVPYIGFIVLIVIGLFRSRK